MARESSDSFLPSIDNVTSPRDWQWIRTSYSRVDGKLKEEKDGRHAMQEVCIFSHARINYQRLRRLPTSSNLKDFMEVECRRSHAALSKYLPKGIFTSSISCSAMPWKKDLGLEETPQKTKCSSHIIRKATYSLFDT